jgi:Protein of unknown function (DUF4238)
MNDPIRHHYSPQFYLRQWAGSDGRLFRYHRPHHRVVVSKRSPEHTGFEDYLYTVEGGDDPQILEKGFFSNVDNYAAPILEALTQLGPGLVILRNGHFTNDQKSDWARFINSLHVRGPHSLAEIDTVLQRSVRDHFERKHGEAYRAAKQPGDPESVYEHVRREVPSLLADAHKFLLTQLIDHEQVGDHIVKMIWAVLDLSDAPHSLLTSDRPYITSHGLLSSECLLSVPVSPTRLFLAVNNMRRWNTFTRQSTKDIARYVNDLVVRMAVENVYGNSADQLAFVEKRLRRADQAPVPGLITLDLPRPINPFHKT